MAAILAAIFAVIFYCLNHKYFSLYTRLTCNLCDFSDVFMGNEDIGSMFNSEK